MNIRSLAPAGPGGNSSSSRSANSSSKAPNGRRELSQANMGRARASWGIKAANLQSSADDISRDGTISNAGANSPGRSPGDELSVNPDEDAEVQERESMIKRGELEKIPTWLLQLHNIFSVTNGPGWKVTEGWPTDRFVPKNASDKFLSTEMYGVTRKFDSPSEVLCIDLAWNGLNGDIETIEGLWGIQTLEVLSLGSNRLSGVLPGPALQQLSNLKELNLYRNGLRGRLPRQIGALNQLTSLWVFENHFTGPLPDVFDSLTGLVDLRCNSNRFSGPIPHSLANCTGLRTLYLQKNEFAGPVPEELYLSCARLKDLRLWANKLTGALNPEVGALKHLDTLMVQQNNLSWMLPVTLGKCAKLVTLDLSKNAFRGELPAEAFKTLSKLKTLNISNNVNLHGKIPNELKELQSLTSIDVSCTGLEDTDEFAAALSSRVRVNTEGFIIDN